MVEIGRRRAGRIVAARALSALRVVARHGERRLAETIAGDRGQGPRHLREGLSELGPTFVKLGQVLSTRPDLVPPRYEQELAHLQDSVPPIEPAAVERALRRELGREPSSVFAFFDEVPIAAASIGQVHAARLIDGREVVVKLRRPGVTAAVAEDLVILDVGAALAARIPGALRRVDIVGFVEQFSETIRGELDYIAEGHNADRARADLDGLPVHVPGVIWEATTHGVLTLERITGSKIDDLDGLDAAGIDRGTLARNLAYVYLSMVFSHGFFHADPHPGNLFVESDGRLAMVDFGMVGEVLPEVREALVEIILALVTHDTRRTVKAMRGLGVAPESVDEDSFITELDRLTASSIETPLGELRLAPLIADLMTVSRRYRLAFPRELALLVKTVVMAEGLAAQLDPSFALPEVLVGFVATNFATAPAPSEPRSGVCRERRRSVTAMTDLSERPLRVGHVLVPPGELEWRFSGSGGPGGQHANTANTRVELRFDIARSPTIGPRQRARLLEKLGPVVRVVASDERSQLRNRDLALARLQARITEALRIERPRRATRPTLGSSERRLESKRLNAQRKRDRRSPLDD